MIHAKAFKDTALFLTAIFMVLAFICIVFKLADYSMFAIGFEICVVAMYFSVMHRIFDYLEFCVITIILCIVGLLLNNILQVEEFIYAGVIVAVISYFKIYNKWAVHEVNKEHNEAIEFFLQNPDAQEYEHSDGRRTLNPKRFDDCKSLEEVQQKLMLEQNELHRSK